ncbi:MAG: GNAT family N-acetyltransferase [Thermoplasmata archaeon]
MPLNLKKVTMSDKREIERLCRDIWEGRDYLPLVFEDWVEDGGFHKGTLDNKIIALDKYTRLENDVLWLEGLRVHPEHQGKGHGKEMVQKFLELIESEEEYTCLRFMTSVNNEKTISMAKEFGFKKHLELHSLMVTEEDKVHKPKLGTRGTVMESSDDRVFTRVKNSKEFEDNKGLFIKNWTAHDMTHELVKKEIGRGNCINFRDGNSESTAFFDIYAPYKLLSIPFIMGDAEGVKKLVNYGINKMFRDGKSYLTMKTSSNHVKDAALDSGMELTRHKKALVFQR